MTHRPLPHLLLGSVLVALGCGSPTPMPMADDDAGEPHVLEDAGAPPDASAPDAGPAPELCPIAPGCAAACPTEGWFGLDASEIEAWPAAVTWDSQSGGGISASSELSADPKIVIDGSGHPVVAWLEGTAVTVARFDGTAWRRVPGSPGVGRAMDLALDAAGQPVVVWGDMDIVHGAKLEDGAWRPIDGGLGVIASEDAASPRVAVDSANNVVVSWFDRASPDRIRVRRWDGARWTPLGVTGPSVGGVRFLGEFDWEPAMALDPAGSPIVVWADETTDRWRIYASGFDGAAWSELGPSGASGVGIGTGLSVSVTVDRAGAPVAAWTDADDVHVARFDGARWRGVGTPEALTEGDPRVHTVAVAVDATDRPVLAWDGLTPGPEGRQIYAARFEGGTWQALGESGASGLGVSQTTGSASAPSLAIDGSNRPVVAWQAQPNVLGSLSEIYVARFDDGAWEAVGPSAAPTMTGGVSDSAGTSEESAVALDAAGRPTVAWVDRSAGDAALLVTRFDGCGWSPVGDLPAEARGARVRETLMAARRPSLALDGEGVPVLFWAERWRAVHELHVARLDGASWTPLRGAAATDDTSGLDGGLTTLWDTSLALSPSGAPIVAWAATRRTKDVFVAQWEEDDWRWLGSETGRIDPTNQPSFAPSIDVDADGRAAVVWSQQVARSENEVWLAMWDGASWQPLGSSMDSPGLGATRGVSRPIVKLHAGDPVVVWIDGGRIHARWWRDGEWRPIGGPDGIVNPEGPPRAQPPALALDHAGMPVVVWADDTTGNFEIQAVRFDGALWQPVAGAVAAGGGLSRSATESREPAVAIEGDLVCVSWTETAHRSREILLRCARLP